MLKQFPKYEIYIGPSKKITANSYDKTQIAVVNSFASTLFLF